MCSVMETCRNAFCQYDTYIVQVYLQRKGQHVGSGPAHAHQKNGNGI